MREELNCFGNFYANFLDGVFMNLPGTIAFIFLAYMGWSYIIGFDLAFMAFFSHFKFADHYLSMAFFYEFDMIMSLLGHKMSAFHRNHHFVSNQHYSAFGFVPDWVFALAPDSLFTKKKD